MRKPPAAPKHLMVNHCRIHFERRVAERLGPQWDAETLWRVLIEEIHRNESKYLTFIARMARNGRRLWRVETSIKTFFVLYDHAIDCPVTVLVDGTVRPQGKNEIDLGEYA